ncbi:MAG: hypothetical protein RJA99_1868 [Pseudomonadota bacterium]|jgi:hypothetical protein
MSAGLPLAILSVLSAVVVATWALKGPGGAALRRAAAAIWAVLLAGCWATLLAAGADGPTGPNATLLAFAVALAGLFAPQLQRWMTRARR